MNGLKIDDFKSRIVIGVSSCLIFAAVVQSCSRGGGSRLNFSNQDADYKLALKPSKLINFFEEKKIPISMLISSWSQSIKDGKGQFKVKDIKVQEDKGHLETDKGEKLKRGFGFDYKKNQQLFFVPKENSTPGQVRIKLEVGLFEKGSSTSIPDSAYKKASCDLYVQYQADDFDVNISKSDYVNTLDASAIPIELTISADKKNSNQGYVVSSWNITGGTGKFCKKNGESISESCSERVVFGKNTFSFIPDENVKGKLSLSIEITNTTTNAKKKIPVTIDLQNKSVVQDENFPIEATIRMLEKNNRSHKSCKLELDIASKSPLASELQYKVLAIQLTKGSLRLTVDGPDLKHGAVLKYGKQEFYFNTDNFSGTFNPLIFIQTNKGKTITVKLKGDNTDYEIEDCGFNAKGEFENNRIVLTLGGRSLSGHEEWTLENWSFKGSISGELQYATESRTVSKNSKHRSGTIFMHLAWDRNIQDLSATPIIVLNFVHPSGVKENISIDLSGLVFPELETQLANLKTILSNSVIPINYETESVDDSINELVTTRKHTINEVKNILVKLDQLFTSSETERRNIDTLVQIYNTFITDNKKHFSATVETAVMAYQAKNAIQNANSDVSHPAESLFRLKSDKATIEAFLSKTVANPINFNHLTQAVEAIRNYLDAIDRAIVNLIANGVTQNLSQQETDNFLSKIDRKRSKVNTLKSSLENLNIDLSRAESTINERDSQINELTSRINRLNDDFNQAIASGSDSSRKQMLISRYASADGSTFISEVFKNEEFDKIDTLFDVIRQGVKGPNSLIPLLKYALQFRSVNVIDFLLSKGILVSEDDISYYIINHWEEGNMMNKKVVKKLLENGSSIKHEPLLEKFTLNCSHSNYEGQGYHSHQLKSCFSVTLLHMAVVLDKKSAYSWLYNNGLADKSIQFRFNESKYEYRRKYDNCNSVCSEQSKSFTAKELIGYLKRDF
jgi:hypothetical protein